MRSPLIRRALHVAGLLIIGAAIFAISAQPNLHASTDPLVDFAVHKTGHFVAFALLAIVAEAMLEGAGMSRPRAVLAAVLVVVGYGATDELHQAFVPGRTPSPIDVTVDLAGGVAGLMLWRRWPTALDDLRPS